MSSEAERIAIHAPSSFFPLLLTRTVCTSKRRKTDVRKVRAVIASLSTHEKCLSSFVIVTLN